MKACPKCSGDLFLDERDVYPEWTCLQCGKVDYDKNTENFVKMLQEKKLRRGISHTKLK